MLIRRLITSVVCCGMLNAAISCNHAPPKNAHPQSLPKPVTIERSDLPPIPGNGLAAGYGGVADGQLIFAGGTDFPDAPPWQGGKKIWHDAIYSLDARANAWRRVGKLGRPLAGGASVSIPAGVLCIGGTDDATVYADVFLIASTPDGIRSIPYPPLPQPRTACSGVLIGDIVYVTSGHRTFDPLAAEPFNDIISLNLNDLSQGWRHVTTVPGPGRWLPVLATDGEALMVISGMYRLAATSDKEGAPAIGFLKDINVYEPSTANWKKLPDLPRAIAGAPSPAPVINGHVILAGGGVGENDLIKPLADRSPFDSIIRYVNLQDATCVASDTAMKPGVAVAPVAPWNGDFVIISGEVRAGVRTPNVQRLR